MNKELLYKIFVVIIGTGCMMVGPYFINFLIVGKVLSVIGLSLLTIQTQKTKSYNLSLLKCSRNCVVIYIASLHNE
jgi:hypothetical protein